MSPSEAELVAARYRAHAESYDAASALAAPFRRRAVDLLELRPGEVVLDVGCGTGLCFACIEERIGPAGALIGIDASPAMLHKAGDRVAGGGWDNVTLIESTAEDADLPTSADAALLCLTHDVLQSDDALKNVCYHMAPGGRVAVLGGKWAPPWCVGLNSLVWALHRPYVRSFEGFERPWRLLERHVEDLRVEPVVFGTAYLASGTIP